MIKFFALLLIPVAAFSQVAELVTVRDGRIYPDGYVSSVSNLVDSVSQVQAGLAIAQATQAAALMISNELAIIQQLETARNATGYMRGFVESFSAGIQADTNLTASIIYFEPAGKDASKAYYNLFTFFTSDPGSWPVVTTSESVGRTNAWDLAESVSVVLTNKIVGAIDYECYANKISMPLDTTNAFFRVGADVSGIGTNVPYMPIDGGLSVNGLKGITITIIQGGITNHYEGGARTQ